MNLESLSEGYMLRIHMESVETFSGPKGIVQGRQIFYLERPKVMTPRISISIMVELFM